MKNKKSSAPQEAETRPSRCPDNSAFKQQKLPAWKPQLTAASVLSTFFLTGAFCLSVGVSLIVAAKSVREIQVCLEWGVWYYDKKEMVCTGGGRGGALNLCAWIEMIALVLCLACIQQPIFL